MSAIQSCDAVSFQGTLNIPVAAFVMVLIGNATAVETDTCKVRVRGSMILQMGASATALNIFLYRGTGGSSTPLGGTAQIQAGFVPGSSCQFMVEYVDILTNASGAQYSMGIAQVGATGLGLLSAAYLEALVISG
jgi:hypothetical protein